MNLHRIKDSQPDWAGVPDSELTGFQRIAKRTNGWVTPGNLVTLAGLAVTTWGLVDVARGNYRSGGTKIVLGRIADLIDGGLADRTQTKGPVGEVLDAGVDKVLIAGAVATLAAKQVIPPAMWVPMAAYNAVSLSAGVVAKRRGVELHVSGEGKYAVFGQWAALCGMTAAAALSRSGLSKAAHAAEMGSWAVAGAAGAIGAVATDGYIRSTWRTDEKRIT